MAKCSGVVDVMRNAAAETWKTWRRHVENGTADTAEGAAAFEAQRLAGAAWLGEVVDRASALRGAARAA